MQKEPFATMELLMEQLSWEKSHPWIGQFD